VKDQSNELGIKYPGFSVNEMILEIKADTDPFSVLPETVEVSLDNGRIISANVQWDEGKKEDNTVSGIIVVPGIKGKVQVNALNEIEDEKENNDKIYFVFVAGLLLSFISLLFLSKKKKKIKDEKT
jgi:hypothetical protein